MAKEDNLKPCRDTETAKARGKLGGIRSGEVKRERKLMSQIYADFLDKDHEILGKDGKKEKMSGNQLLSKVMSKVLSRGDSAAVSLMKEIREATEGNKVAVNLEDNELVINILPTSTDKDEHQDT